MDAIYNNYFNFDKHKNGFDRTTDETMVINFISLIFLGKTCRTIGLINASKRVSRHLRNRHLRKRHLRKKVATLRIYRMDGNIFKLSYVTTKKAFKKSQL